MSGNKNGKLAKIFGKNTIGIVSANNDGKLIVDICNISVDTNDILRVYTNKIDRLNKGDLITVFLDNRTDASFITWRFSIYRCVYKTLVVEIKDNFIILEPISYNIIYRHKVIDQFTLENFQDWKDERKVIDLPVSNLTPPLEASSKYNKSLLGVLITKGIYYLHLTITAYLFLSNNNGLIIISQQSSLKSRLLNRDNECWFLLDNRRDINSFSELKFNLFHLNANIIPREVPEKHRCYGKAKKLFTDINRFQKKLFDFPNIIMYHLTPFID